jgi:epoxyqueuosine reductase
MKRFLHVHLPKLIRSESLASFPSNMAFPESTIATIVTIVSITSLDQCLFMTGEIHPLTKRLKTEAQNLGFSLVGITPATTPGRLDSLHSWLDAGYAGTMHYLENRREAYSHPSHVLEGCKTLLMLGLPYNTSMHERQKPEQTPWRGRVARYAIGDADYHDVIHMKLKQLKQWLEQQQPGCLVRGVVDTAPLLEREFAELAGLGWVGKNTLLLNRNWGSYFFLAALLTDIELACDPPHEKGYCGTCTACLDECPTNAFPTPYVLDASRCISYLTIEHRETITPELSSKLGDWVFGCDICQEVCPWNRKAEQSFAPEFSPRPDLVELSVAETLSLSEEQFRERYRKTPLWRSKRRGILRNAILVAVNQGLIECSSVLVKLTSDPEPILRASSAWALMKLKPDGWEHTISSLLSHEEDPEVRMQVESFYAEINQKKL